MRPDSLRKTSSTALRKSVILHFSSIRFEGLPADRPVLVGKPAFISSVNRGHSPEWAPPAVPGGIRESGGLPRSR